MVVAIIHRATQNKNSCSAYGGGNHSQMHAKKYKHLQCLLFASELSAAPLLVSKLSRYSKLCNLEAYRECCVFEHVHESHKFLLFTV